jgi:hypothetical protein
MTHHRPQRLRPALLTLALLVLGIVQLQAQVPGAPVERQAAQVVKASHLIQEVFGPLPAVAGTPFLGLAVLSGAALLSDTDAVRTSDSAILRGFRDNALLIEGRRYASLPLFLSLLALSLLTWMANSGKIRGAAGKILRAAEDCSVLVTYGLLALVTVLGAPSQAPEPRVVMMGVWSVPAEVLLSLGFALALAVMMTVRYAFDVIIWLSPFPFVDFAFEVLKKLLSLAFLALYFVSPAAASVVGLLVLIPALFLYGWAVRILSFTFRIVLRPVLAKLLPELRTDVTEGEHLTAPASALALPGLPRRAPGTIRRGPEGVLFVTSSRLRRRRVVLPGKLSLCRALFWFELRAVDAAGRLHRIALPRTYAPCFDRLRALLGAEDGGSIGAVRVFGKLADEISRWGVSGEAPGGSSGGG